MLRIPAQSGLDARTTTGRLGGMLAGQLVRASLFASVTLGAASAEAHMGSTKAVVATVTSDGVDLEVGVEAVDAAMALGLGTGTDAEELGRHAGLVQRWLSGGLSVASEAGPCTATASTPSLTQRSGKDNVSVTLQYRCPNPKGAITLTDDTVFDDDPDHEVFVSVHGRQGDTALVLRAEQRSVVLTAPPEAGSTAAAFVVEGGIHLITGYDHLLFLLSLILAAGLIVPRDGLRAALRDVAWVVTAFTIGHSISLVVATLGWVSLPSRWVESAIAASIVAVAGMNVARPRASVARPWLAGTFGLIHGFGFSSVLADVGLPTGQRLVALLSFNVGIELAQLAVVAVVLIPLSLAARHARYRLVVMQGGSLAIATFGCIWLVERVWGS